MNAKLRLVLVTVLVLVFSLGVFHPRTVKADVPPDVLDSYTITITPQADGQLQMVYNLKHYCTYSDWPGDKPYLQIGVPNTTFTITDFGPSEGEFKPVKAEPLTSDGSYVQMDFDSNHLPKNGNCFDLNFSITQGKMAYPTTDSKEITYKFTPSGWTFPITVKQLTVSWAVPSDASLLKLTDPVTTGKTDTALIWQWNNPVMNGSGMFADYSVKLVYDQSAFQLTDTSTSQSSDSNGGSGGISGGTILVIIIVVVVVILLLVVFVGVFSDDGYGGGGGIILGGGSGGGHSGGGGLGGSGGGYSCACAGCACACACAGGGKVGCSRKFIGIACLQKVIARLGGKDEAQTASDHPNSPTDDHA